MPCQLQTSKISAAQRCSKCFTSLIDPTCLKKQPLWIRSLGNNAWTSLLQPVRQVKVKWKALVVKVSSLATKIRMDGGGWHCYLNLRHKEIYFRVSIRLWSRRKKVNLSPPFLTKINTLKHGVKWSGESFNLGIRLELSAYFLCQQVKCLHEKKVEIYHPLLNLNLKKNRLF